jgi:hypothetical protein
MRETLTPPVIPTLPLKTPVIPGLTRNPVAPPTSISRRTTQTQSQFFGYP